MYVCGGCSLFYFVFETGSLTMCPRLALNPRYSYLSLPSARIIEMCHEARFLEVFKYGKERENNGKNLK